MRECFLTFLNKEVITLLIVRTNLIKGTEPSGISIKLMITNEFYNINLTAEVL